MKRSMEIYCNPAQGPTITDNDTVEIVCLGLNSIITKLQQSPMTQYRTKARHMCSIVLMSSTQRIISQPYSGNYLRSAASFGSVLPGGVRVKVINKVLVRPTGNAKEILIG